MEEQKAAFLEWVKSHKKQLIFAGISISMIILTQHLLTKILKVLATNSLKFMKPKRTGIEQEQLELTLLQMHGPGEVLGSAAH